MSASLEDGADMRLEQLIKHPVLVVSRTTCSFCTEAKRLLAEKGVAAHIVEVDKDANGFALRSQAQSATAHKTLPMIWIKQQFIGGCQDLLELNATGRLDVLLDGLDAAAAAAPVKTHDNESKDSLNDNDEGEAQGGGGRAAHAGEAALADDDEVTKPQQPAGSSAAVQIYPGPTCATEPLFVSGETADNRVVRIAGVLTSLICVVLIAFGDKGNYGMAWATLALFLDFLARVFGASGLSPVAATSAAIRALVMPNVEPQWSCNAPKQFAAVCGLMFSGIAAAMALSGQFIGARVVLAMLLGASGLQGVFDICAGCIFFGLAIDFGLLPKTLYRLHVQLLPEKMHQWRFFHNRKGTGNSKAPQSIVYGTHGVPSNPTDLKAKPRLDLDKWEWFDMVKYMHVSHFGCSLGVCSAAFAWHTLSSMQGTPDRPWQVLAVVSAVCFAVEAGLFSLKALFYPSKVVKEWQHPVKGSLFSLAPFTLLILALLAADFNDTLAKVLFWVGAVLQLFVAVGQVGAWVARRWSVNAITPAMFLPALGGMLVASTSTTTYPSSDHYLQLARFAFGFAVLMYAALWPLTLFRAITSANADERKRPLELIWVAAPALTALAYLNVGAGEFDLLASSLFFAGLGIGLCLMYAAWPLGYFTQNGGGFTMDRWVFAFPINALAALAVLYDDAIATHASAGLAYALVALGSVVTFSLAVSTLSALAERAIFVPIAKWGPMSFFSLTHEAFRSEAATIYMLLEALPAASGANASGSGAGRVVRALHARLNNFARALSVHSHQEDKIIFPLLNWWFPGSLPAWDEEHSNLHALENDVLSAVAAAAGEPLPADNTSGSGSGSGSSSGKAVSAAAPVAGEDAPSSSASGSGLREKVDEYLSSVTKHLKREEDCFSSPITRKYWTLAMQQEALLAAWSDTKPQDMSDLLSFVLSSLPMHGQKVRFLRALVWAMPERAQLVGLMTYRRIDDASWVSLARAIPEMIPKGLPGYVRQY